jgi:hypothetical protein
MPYFAESVCARPLPASSRKMLQQKPVLNITGIKMDKRLISPVWIKDPKNRENEYNAKIEIFLKREMDRSNFFLYLSVPAQ